MVRTDMIAPKFIQLVASSGTAVFALDEKGRVWVNAVDVDGRTVGWAPVPRTVWER